MRGVVLPTKCFTYLDQVCRDSPVTPKEKSQTKAHPPQLRFLEKKKIIFKQTAPENQVPILAVLRKKPTISNNSVRF
jgi:hypothetical protein